MSKLLEKLRKAAQAEPQRLGFGTHAREAKRSTVVLVAEVATPHESLARRAIQQGADALFVASWQREDLQSLQKGAGEIPWGVRIPDYYEGDGSALTDAGCDFIAFGTTGTPAAVLRWEQIGRVLELSPEIPDARLRAAELLPVELLFLDDRGEGPVTVGDILDLGRLMAFVRKPSIIRPRLDLKPTDVAALRDCGIDGVIVTCGDSGWEDRFQQFRTAIDTLPPRAKRQRAPVEPTIPQARQEAGRRGEND